MGMLTTLTKETDDTLKKLANNGPAMNIIHDEHFNSAMKAFDNEAANQNWDQHVREMFRNKLEKRIKVCYFHYHF